MKREPVDEVTALREATREAHEAIKDLSRLLRESQKARAELQTAIADLTHERIEQETACQILAMADRLKVFMDESVDHVLKQFARLERLVLGDERNRTRPTLMQVAGAMERNLAQDPSEIGVEVIPGMEGLIVGGVPYLQATR